MAKRHFTINYDIMPRMGINPWTFNVSSFTWVANLAGHLGATNHCQLMYPDWTNLDVKFAAIRASVLKTGGSVNPQVRFYSLHDVAGVQVREDIGTLTCDPQFTPNNMSAMVTGIVQGWKVSTTRQITAEVLGVGSMFQCTLEVVHEIEDNAEAIADLLARVAALEARA